MECQVPGVFCSRQQSKEGLTLCQLSMHLTLLPGCWSTLSCASLRVLVKTTLFLLRSSPAHLPSLDRSPSGGRRKTRSNKNTRMWGWEVAVRTQPFTFPVVYGKLTLPSNLLPVTSHHAESLQSFPAFPVFHFYCLILIESQLIHILL